MTDETTNSTKPHEGPRFVSFVQFVVPGWSA